MACKNGLYEYSFSKQGWDDILTLILSQSEKKSRNEWDQRDQIYSDGFFKNKTTDIILKMKI